ncbi:MAG: leucyl aminopeptidase family protein, partial [Rhabdochlamydiaceae bacterium]
MQLVTVPKIADRPEADLVVLPFWQGSKKAEPACSLAPFKSELEPILQADDFKGKEEETVLIYTGKKKESRLLLLGCGKKSETSPETFRKAVAPVVKLCRQKGWSTLNIVCPEEGSYHVPITEGVLLSNYVYERLKHDTLKEGTESSLKKLCLIGSYKNQDKECKRAQTIIEAVNFARDLINGNADDITPQKLSETAHDLCKTSSSLKATILGKKEIIKAGLGLLLAVNRASFRDPALIIVEYRGNPSSKDCTAIIGKGITYDTGGLILKPRGSMETMKDDMSGGAAVLGTLKAAAALKLPVNIIGII